MPIEALSNLKKIGKLKAEQPQKTETERMLGLARQRLQDSSLPYLI
jgi:hypothetical protein